MKSIWVKFLLIICLFASGSQLFPAPLDDLRFPIPRDWTIIGDPSAYPIRLAHGSGNAEVTIFRSDLPADEVISTSKELRESVQKVIDSVILTLPKAKLLSNTGFKDSIRTGFALDFFTEDPSDQTQLRHRLIGWLYRIPDGSQVLFTIWGKSPTGSYPEYEQSIMEIQQSFSYIGPRSQEPLASKTNMWSYPLLLTAIGAIIFLFYRTIKIRSRKISSQSEFWTCNCGIVNSPSSSSCSKCGRLNERITNDLKTPEVQPGHHSQRMGEQRRS
jgi:hypothetical protein